MPEAQGPEQITNGPEETIFDFVELTYPQPDGFSERRLTELGAGLRGGRDFMVGVCLASLCSISSISKREGKRESCKEPASQGFFSRLF